MKGHSARSFEGFLKGLKNLVRVPHLLFEFFVVVLYLNFKMIENVLSERFNRSALAART